MTFELALRTVDDWPTLSNGATDSDCSIESAGDAHLDTEFRCDESSAGTDVALAPKPELPTVVKSRGNGFGDEPPGSAESGRDPRRFVEVGTGIENLQHVRMWGTQRFSISPGEAQGAG
jgi:hypothetical protein